MSTLREDLTIALDSVDAREKADNTLALALHTSRGTIEALFHPCPEARAAVICVSGVSGGMDGPSSLFDGLAQRLGRHQIATLRLDYRRKSILQECILDVLVGVAFLGGLGITHIALVGHAFGGAVVIMAGAVSQQVTAVAALASQTYGTAQVDRLAPRPLLLLHGDEDDILPPACSEEIFRRANEAKVLVTLPATGHDFEQRAAEAERVVASWLLDQLPS